MAIDNFTTATTVTEDDYMKAHGYRIDGLLRNLMKHQGYGTHYEPERLKAISRQADNVRAQALFGLQTIGKTLTTAAQSGDLDDKATEGVGYRVEFLSDMAMTMDHHIADAELAANRSTPPHKPYR